MAKLIALISCSFVLIGIPGCGGGSDRPASCDAPISPGPSPIRRLTRAEYNSTIFQLLGDSSNPADAFPPDERSSNFDNQAATLVVSPLLAEQYLLAAEKLATDNLDRLMRDVPACSGASPDRAQCQQEAEVFIRDFGKRAFRRPLSDEEVATHSALFEQGTGFDEAEYSAPMGIQVVVQAMLQSPFFLYRVEFGSPNPVEGDVVPLTSYEIASRLSYLLWNTMPDTALFEAAEQDELKTAKQIEDQARRMLETPRAREAVKNFHRQWLRLVDIEEVVRANGKNLEVYPEYRESLLPIMRQETELYFDHAIFEENASVDTLFTASYTMMNEALAEYYGVNNGPSGDAFVKVELDPSRYAGFLTHPGLLSLYALADRSSPIHRGKFVREYILCQAPPPPPDVVPSAPLLDPTQTTREQFEAHRSEPVCAGCHQLMDPIGFGLEQFDGIGRYRATENGLPIDTTGEIIGANDADGTFNGVVELSQRLGNSEHVRQCVATQWFRFAYGRTESTEDTCSQDSIFQQFEDSGFDIKELIVALTQTDAFRYRRAISAEEVSQ